jgi:hypothetical protein
MSNNDIAHITEMCRLKTKRKKKRQVKQDHDKHLLQINRLQLKIWKKKRDLGYVELKPPIQKGWERIFILREDIANTDKSEFFLGILNRINTRQFSHRKDFKKKRKRHGKKVNVEREQFLKRLSEWEFKKANFTEIEKVYFIEVDEFDPSTKKTSKRYLFTEPWRFVLKIRPHMITHHRVIDPELESMEAQINRALNKNENHYRLSKLLHGWARYCWRQDNNDKLKYKNWLKDQPLHVIRAYYESYKNDLDM